MPAILGFDLTSKSFREIAVDPNGNLMLGPRKTFCNVRADSHSVAYAGDMEHGTISWHGTFAPVTVNDLNAAHASFTTATKYFRVPMGVAGYTEAALSLLNGTGVACTVSVQADLSGAAAAEQYYCDAYEIASWSVGNGSIMTLTPYSTTTGAVAWTTCAALATPMAYLVLAVTAASDPAAGHLQISISRR